MGLGSWVKQAFGTKPAKAVPPGEPGSPSDEPVGLSVTISTGTALCVELAGTTTFTKDAVAALADRHNLGTRGYYEGPAQLQREPDNPADPHAVAVIVEGEKVGYLPSPANRGTGLRPGASAPATYQLHVLREAKLKAKAFVWLGDGQPEWDHTEDNPPGLTTAERANEAHREMSGMVQEALASGGARATQFKRGMVDGVHYLELVEPIKQLKRDGRLEEALVLCYKAITAAEGDAGGREPAPWYTEQAAIVHRKLAQKDEEIAVLKRWLAKCPKAHRSGSRIAERLAKLEVD
jgi:hypothetical protein